MAVSIADLRLVGSQKSEIRYQKKTKKIFYPAEARSYFFIYRMGKFFAHPTDFDRINRIEQDF